MGCAASLGCMVRGRGHRVSCSSPLAFPFPGDSEPQGHTWDMWATPKVPSTARTALSRKQGQREVIPLSSSSGITSGRPRVGKGSLLTFACCLDQTQLWARPCSLGPVALSISTGEGAPALFWGRRSQIRRCPFLPTPPDAHQCLQRTDPGPPASSIHGRGRQLLRHDGRCLRGSDDPEVSGLRRPDQRGEIRSGPWGPWKSPAPHLLKPVSPQPLGPQPPSCPQ